MKEHLFEQMNTSAYKDSTNPFESLYEASNDGFTEIDIQGYTDPTATSTKMINMTSDEIQKLRDRLELEEEMNNFGEPVEGVDEIGVPAEEPLPELGDESEGMPPEAGLEEPGLDGELGGESVEGEEGTHEEILDTVETLSAKFDKLNSKLDELMGRL